VRLSSAITPMPRSFALEMRQGVLVVEVSGR
jgi:hypothetical protein